MRPVERTAFTASTMTGELVGWVTGDGPQVLAVHGGPGLNYDYLDAAVTELATRYRVATFQQRGLAPSTEGGAFTVAEAVADLGVVLDALGWDVAYLMGHSWGGHLAIHTSLCLPARLAGVLAVDPLGAVGDGGEAQFGAELLARAPAQDQERFRQLDAKETAGDSTPEDDLEAFSLIWPSYFADRATAPPMPHIVFAKAANEGLFADLRVRLPELEESLPSITVPVGVLVGELSPMPPSAGTTSAARIPGGWSHVVPGAGHFPWFESPGSLLSAMDRLVGQGLES